ncbi:MAG TPA: SPOR domain-containing protein [Tepidisphaeraceae bacterium]|nr:SPOR domain-containing protein [Tepidisphaeraceae bacterium]
MRNVSIVRTGSSRTVGALIMGLAIIPWLGGCLDGGSRQTLNKGYSELNSGQYDDAGADADEFLRAHPNGSGVAEAYYLKGRIEEQKAQDATTSPTLADKRAHLDAARDEYDRGLDSLAPIGVKALLHTGLANVDYYEEDYSSALREWTSAYDNIQSDDTKAWVLYHIGRSEQRLGMFDKADEAFAKVERLYPGSEAANRSRMRIGATAFYVEVGSFTNPNLAEAAAAELRKANYAASRTTENGLATVRVGPIPSYADAKAFQSRLRSQYPGAIISP